jgi:hypothetical protein
MDLKIFTKKKKKKKNALSAVGRVGSGFIRNVSGSNIDRDTHNSD